MVSNVTKEGAWREDIDTSIYYDFKHGKYRPVVSALITLDDCLLFARASSSRHKWNPFQGGVNKKNGKIEGFETAILREINEETNGTLILHQSVTDNAFYCGDFLVRGYKRKYGFTKGTHYYYIHYALDTLPTFLINPREIIEAQWLHFSEFPGILSTHRPERRNAMMTAISEIERYRYIETSRFENQMDSLSVEIGLVTY